MAVLKDIEVTIQINGQALHEFDDDDGVKEKRLHIGGSQGEGDSKSKDNGGRKGGHCKEKEGRGGGLLKTDMTNPISKYIEATSDACFAIKTRLLNLAKPISDVLRLDVYLDGVYVDNRVMNQLKYRAKNKNMEHCFYGTRSQNETGTFLRPFMFKAIEHGDSTGPSAQKSTKDNFVADLGTIVFKVRRVGNVRPKVEQKLAGYHGLLLDSADIDEKALKGLNITHSASFGEEQKIPAFKSVTMDHIDKDIPYATFKFRYCSKEALQAKLLIPRTPSPSRSPTPTRIPWEARPLDELTLHQVRELARRQQAMYQAGRGGAGIKSEPGPGLETGRTAPTTQGGKRGRDAEDGGLVATARVGKARTRLWARGEVVDLSD